MKFYVDVESAGLKESNLCSYCDFKNICNGEDKIVSGFKDLVNFMGS
jgi:hypothetical protein